MGALFRVSSRLKSGDRWRYLNIFPHILSPPISERGRKFIQDADYDPA
jgi:hypothetical protein